MRRVPLILTLMVALALHTGCSNGPLARMLRGGECSTCSQMPSQTYPYAYETSGCATCGVNAAPSVGTGTMMTPDFNAPFTGQPDFRGTLHGTTQAQ